MSKVKSSGWCKNQIGITESWVKCQIRLLVLRSGNAQAKARFYPSVERSWPTFPEMQNRDNLWYAPGRPGWRVLPGWDFERNHRK